MPISKRNLVVGAIAAAALLTFPSAGQAADRLMVHHSKKPTKAESGLEYEYTFKVMTHKSQEPVNGADFMISTDMPAMPGAHHMPHVKAVPTGETGTYKAKLDFDMPGDWNLILKFTKPQRDQLVISDMIEKKGGHSGHSSDHSKHGKSGDDSHSSHTSGD